MPQHDLGLPHRADARRRPRHDQRPPLQRRALRQERDRLRDAEDHLARVGRLDRGAVVDGADGQRVRGREVRGRHEAGADWGGGVEAWWWWVGVSEETPRRGEGRTFGEGPLRVAELLRAGADVVAAGVAEDVVEGALRRDVAPGLADDDGEFGFVVARAVLAEFGDADLLRVGPAEGGAGFDEEDRVGRDRHVGFARVVAVIEPEAADDGDFFGGDGGEELGDCHGSVGDDAVEYGACDEVRFDLFLFDGRDADVGVGLGVYLSQVGLAIFLGNEADEMGPVGWHDGE